MVYHSHFLTGNSESSQLRDLFTEFRISWSNSHSISSPQALSSDNMVEPEAIPTTHGISSNDSSNQDFAT